MAPGQQKVPTQHPASVSCTRQMMMVKDKSGEIRNTKEIIFTGLGDSIIFD